MNLEADPGATALVPPVLNYNITDEELNRDIVSLHLPELANNVATDEGLRALHPSGD
ncbi:MAG: hypothetical protein ACRYG7_17970 [Janthinobacterium lividum]